MTVRGRILAIRLAESIGRQQSYADSIGIAVEFKAKNGNAANRKEQKE